ncbi:MAG: M91 family zinc metallopeptidase [Methylococcales bacterium]|nr:M91 family zinc metallopeptidase [Methylococcales bacterium]
MATWDKSYPGIIIQDGDTAFIEETRRNLNLIKSKPIGQDLLALLSKRCKGVGCSIPGGGTVEIRHAPGTLVGERAKKTNAAPTSLQALKGKKLPGSIVQLSGKGSGSIANYDPNAEAEYTRMVGIYTPEFVALAHELIHSLHHMSGGLRMGAGSTIKEQFQAMYLHEEAHTVGLGPYAKTRICENAIRKEWGHPQRTFYSNAGDCDALVSLGGTV